MVHVSLFSVKFNMYGFNSGKKSDTTSYNGLTTKSINPNYDFAVFVVYLSHKYETGRPFSLSLSPYNQNSESTLSVQLKQFDHSLIGFETSEACKILSKHINLSFLSLILNSPIYCNLAFTLAMSAKCFAISVERIIEIINSRNLL